MRSLSNDSLSLGKMGQPSSLRNSPSMLPPELRLHVHQIRMDEPSSQRKACLGTLLPSQTINLCLIGEL